MLSFSFVQFASIAAIVSSALAHMDVADPPPLRSKNNAQYKNGNNIDYSMTSPLAGDGSNFPCKGYQVDVPGSSTAVATLNAGQNFTVKMEGSAAHGGGSCQFSMSYDNGKTFGVVHNEVGGCMLAESYSFAVPAELPSAKNVLLSWTWFNRIGNREMYQNCIAVDVAGSSTGPISLSKMFVANIGNGCVTKEGMDIDFANPSAGLQAGCTPITPDQKVSIGPSGSSSGGGAADPAPAPSSTPAPSTDAPSTDAPSGTSTDVPSSTYTDAPAPSGTDDGSADDGSDDGDEDDCPEETDTSSEPSAPESTSAPEPSSAPAPEPTSAPAPVPTEAPSTGTGGSCTPGAMLCSADGLSWSMCANGSYMNMGAVAPGTKCVGGSMVAAKRSPSGYRSHTMRRLEWDH